MQAGRQVLGHAELLVGMHAATDQHHHLARLHGLGQRVGHAAVTRDLNAGHGCDLALGQEIAMALAYELLLRFEGRCRQSQIKLRVGHAGAHVAARQVRTQHRNTCALR